jgi:hypothetical protein
MLLHWPFLSFPYLLHFCFVSPPPLFLCSVLCSFERLHFFFSIRNGHGACSIKLQSIPHVHMAVKSGNGSHIHFPIGTILCYLCAVQSTQTKGRKFNLTFGSDGKELMQKTQSDIIWSLSSTSSSSSSSSNCQWGYWLNVLSVGQLYYKLLCFILGLVGRYSIINSVSHLLPTGRPRDRASISNTHEIIHLRSAYTDCGAHPTPIK